MKKKCFSTREKGSFMRENLTCQKTNNTRVTLGVRISNKSIRKISMRKTRMRKIKIISGSYRRAVDQSTRMKESTMHFQVCRKIIKRIITEQSTNVINSKIMGLMKIPIL
jgi:hypothetical protein